MVLQKEAKISMACESNPPGKLHVGILVIHFVYGLNYTLRVGFLDMFKVMVFEVSKRLRVEECSNLSLADDSEL